MKPSIFFTLLMSGCLLKSQVYARENPLPDQGRNDQHIAQLDLPETNVGHQVDVSADHGHDEEQEHHKTLSTRIGEAMASQVGIKTARVLSQRLQQSIITYGSLITGPEQLSHVRARYTGLIKSVTPTIGDAVTQGDLLAEVESNESLKTYQIRAPITGTIIQRHANTGEVTQQQILFSIANFDSLWAELRIYPSLQSVVKAGQNVHIDEHGWNIAGPIAHIIPTLDKPYQLARIQFDNRLQGLAPGLLVAGRIIIGEFKVDLAITKMAVQTLGEEQGVFVKKGNEYTFQPLRLGRSDAQYIEVLSGLLPGQDYVSENSYLIKADIEKSAAEHQH